MLLVCPNCSARYLVSSASLGEDGRDVRCAKCSYEWFQELDSFLTEEGLSDDSAQKQAELEILDEPDARIDPDSVYEFVDAGEEKDSAEVEDIVEESLSDEIAPVLDDPIPDSVKPQHDKINVPALPEGVSRPSVSFQAKVTGYFSALALFALVLGAAVLFKQQIVSSWPPALAIYNLAGLSVPYKGEDLVIESLIAQVQKDVDGRDFLTLQGRVINLTNNVQQVPTLYARLRSTNGEDGEGWNIDSPLEKLEPGESFTFKSDYPALPRGVGSVNLSFVPAAEI